jgi:poly(hydroxyalkanoate) granule-associated protein
VHDYKVHDYKVTQPVIYHKRRYLKEQTMGPQPTVENSPAIDVHNETVTDSATLFLAARRLLLASLGAVAFSIDEAKDLIEKMVARGEIAESDTQVLLQEFRTRLNQKREGAGAAKARAKVTKAAQALEVSVEEILHRFNVPSKREIEALRKKIDLLNQKVDDLAQK